MTDKELIIKLFPNFNEVSEDEQFLILREIKERSSRIIDKTKETVFGWKLFFLGILTGVIINLWSSVLFEYFKEFKLYFVYFLTLITLALMSQIINIFADNIDNQMSTDPVIKKSGIL